MGGNPVVSALLWLTKRYGDAKMASGVLYTSHAIECLRWAVRAGCSEETQVLALLSGALDSDAIAASCVQSEFGYTTLCYLLDGWADANLPPVDRLRKQMENVPCLHNKGLDAWMADLIVTVSERIERAEMFNTQANAGFLGWSYARFQRALWNEKNHMNLVLKAALFELFLDAHLKGLFSMENTTEEGIEKYYAMVETLAPKKQPEPEAPAQSK